MVVKAHYVFFNHWRPAWEPDDLGNPLGPRDFRKPAVENLQMREYQAEDNFWGEGIFPRAYALVAHLPSRAPEVSRCQCL